MKQDHICKTCFLSFNPHFDSGDIMLDDSSFLGHDAVLVGNQNQVFYSSVFSSSSRIIKMTLRYLQTLGSIISQKNRSCSCTTVKPQNLSCTYNEVYFQHSVYSNPDCGVAASVVSFDLC